MPTDEDAGRWNDFLDEAAAVCLAAAKGDLEPRIGNIPDDRRLKDLAVGVNSLLDSVDAYVRESLAALKASSERRYYRVFIEQGMPGAFRRGASQINMSKAVMAKQAQALQDSRSFRAQVVQELENLMAENSSRMESMIQGIDRIMNGIKVLSLNALIEAARAGDAGRGFSVVANEVKRMADNIGQAMDKVRQEAREFHEESSRVIHLIMQDQANSRPPGSPVPEPGSRITDAAA